MRKTSADRREVSLLKYVKNRKRFEEKVIKLVDVEAQNMWGYFKDGILRHVCGKSRGRLSKEDTWWWNEDVKEAVSRKKDAHKTVCQDNTDENMKMHKCMEDKAKKTVSRAIREKADRNLLNYNIAQMAV